MTLHSKELVSAVFGHYCFNIEEGHTRGEFTYNTNTSNTPELSFDLEESLPYYRRVNIYEFMNMVKEWILTTSLKVSIIVSISKKGIHLELTRYDLSKIFVFGTEFEAVMKAGEWILDKADV